MTTSFPIIKPCSQITHVIGLNTMIRVLNKSAKKARVSNIVALAREVHADLKKPNQSMPEYTEGCCHDAALTFCHKAPERFEFLEDNTIIRGYNVPGSRGHYPLMGLSGLHHLALLYFRDMNVAVDMTAAQLYRKNPDFKNTEVLLVITEPDDKNLSTYLQNIYGGGIWNYLIMGF